MKLPAARSFAELLHQRAQALGGQAAYVFLRDGEDEQEALSCAELDLRARRIAAQLLALRAQGQRALLLFAPGLDYIAAFFGCLYAGVVAVPAYPPRNARALPRIQAIVADAQAAYVLASAADMQRMQPMAAELPGLQALHWLATDSLPPTDDAVPPPLQPDSVAFLQYTSGSTGEPKGVVLTHANLLHNSELISRAFGTTPDSVGMSWLPPYHDMGLIGGILQPLYAGITCHLMAPAVFLQRPLRWLQTISRAGVTHSGGPDFAYELCARKITPEQRAGLDLRRWKVAFNGAEPVRAATLARFADTFADCGFRPEAFLPCYGLAEATLLVSGSRGAVQAAVDPRALEQGRITAPAGTAAAQTLVASGALAAATGACIVHPDTLQRCADGEVGEIWVCSDSVAQGYWQRPELSAQVFGARQADGSGPWLRTGDLGAAHEGQLYVTGRIKDLVILRGRNLYPTDIEAAVQASDSALRPGFGAAFGVDIAGEEQLVILQEMDFRRQPEGEATAQAIVRAVAEAFEVLPHAVLLLKAGTLPTTSSGKLRRREARKLYLAGSLEPLATSTAAAPAQAQATAASGLTAWLAARIAPRLGLAPQALDIDRPFTDFGLGSVEAVELSGALETHLGRRLPPTLLWDHPSIRSLAAHLEGRGQPAPRPAATPTGTASAVAIIGMACRLPGAPDLQAFWQLLSQGGDAISEVPADRWDSDALYDARPGTPGRLSTRWGGFIADIDAFDASFFGIPAAEARLMDPQQRLLLETAWHALEHAGLAPGSLAGSNTGVYIGIGSNDYARRLAGQLDAMEAPVGTGNASSVAANRISYQLGLTGPSMAVDTACSASLVAVHLACQSLRSGETELALAGGVNVMLEPDLTVAFSQAGMLAADGRCKTFDARADGYVRGEGCGVVVLKRLADAQRDGDPVLAVLCGSAVNQSGRSNGLTAPSRSAQRAVVQRALAQAGVSAAELGYIEAHGTGTALGDPIEIQALAEVLGELVPEVSGTAAAAPGRTQACAVGSVKTNIGHLEAAAGIAGLIKTVLMLQHRQLAPHLHVQQLNPRLRRARLPLRVPGTLQAWDTPAGQGRVAGVSSFGFGGSNAHVVLREAPPLPAQPVPAPGLQLLALSARGDKPLRELALRWRQTLATLAPEQLDQACQVSRSGRSRLSDRLCVLGADAQALAAGLDNFLCGRQDGRWWHGCVPGTAAPGVCFVATPAPEADPALQALQSELVTQWQRWGVRPVAAQGQGVPPGIFLQLACMDRDGPPPELPPQALWLPGPVLHADPEPALLAQLARLWVAGVELDWLGFRPRRTRLPLALPAYPFQRERHWAEAARRPRASVSNKQEAA